jgi:hypothetical protein
MAKIGYMSGNFFIFSLFDFIVVDSIRIVCLILFISVGEMVDAPGTFFTNNSTLIL